METNNQQPPRDPLARLTQLNPTLVVLATLALFLGVLLLPDPVGAALILAIVAGLGWLLSRTWPVLAPSAHTLRLAVMALLVVVALVKLFG
jgi:hypothetical protein